MIVNKGFLLLFIRVVYWSWVCKFRYFPSCLIPTRVLVCNRSFHSNSPSVTKILCSSFCINSADWFVVTAAAEVALLPVYLSQLSCWNRIWIFRFQQECFGSGSVSCTRSVFHSCVTWMSSSTYELPSPRTGLVLLCSLTLIWVGSTELLHLLHNVSNQLFMDVWWLQTVFNLSMKVKRWENKVTEQTHNSRLLLEMWTLNNWDYLLKRN